MTEKLSKQDQDFVKEVAEHGNATKAVKKAYKDKNYTEGYARVKGSELLTMPNISTAIEEVKKSLADRIPDDLLERVHLEGLNAGKTIRLGDNEIVEPDHAIRHRFLDTALKLKGAYAPEKSINLNLEANIADPRAQELAQEYEEKLKQGL